MPEVISNTSPLQYLHQAGCLELLEDLYGSVLVPRAVVGEIRAGRALGVELPDPEATRWMHVVPAPHPKILPLASELGAGEREALALAAERDDSLLILDDRLARRFAAHLGLKMTGTLGVLLKAKKADLIDRVEPMVATLDSLGFRLSDATRRAILSLAGEF